MLEFGIAPPGPWTLGLQFPAPTFEVSPDGQHLVAVTETDGVPMLWVRAIASQAWRRLPDTEQAHSPVWSPDGEHVIFNSVRTGSVSLFRRPSNGSGEDELVAAQADASLVAPDWSPDGRNVIISRWTSSGERGIWLLPLSGDRTPVPWLDTPFADNGAVFSPDGRWVAYDSDESGPRNVYVRSFPAGNELYRISRNGGRAARWRADGRELFFMAPDGTLVATAIDTSSGFHAALPEALFQTGLLGVIEHMNPYAVSRDGERFLMPVLETPPPDTPVTVIWNWPALLRR